MKRNLYILYIIALCATSKAIAQRPVPAAYNNDIKINYVRTWDAIAPESDPNNFTITSAVTHSRMTTQYVDGLGRPIQTVIKKGSLETSSGAYADVVSPIVYDEFGREQFKYLPFVSTTNNGFFKINPFQQQATFMNAQYSAQGETYFYGKTVFEESPLNRVLKTFAPGNNWIGQEGTDAQTCQTWTIGGLNYNACEPLDHSIKIKYEINRASDDVKIWNVTNVTGGFGNYVITGAYPAGELYKTITMDEHNKQVIEFKDKEGKVILKKNFANYSCLHTTGYLYTSFRCISTS